jgi:hypothetical protein
MRQYKRKFKKTILLIKKNWIFSLFVFIVFIIVSILIFKYINFYKQVDSLKSAQFIIDKKNDLADPDNEGYVSTWGAYGDFIGGTLNPLLTFISIIFLAWTILQNKSALRINSKELKLSREANQISSTAQIAIQKTQSLQQFDSIFFPLLNQLNAYSSALNEKSELSGTILSQIYDDVFENNKYPFVKGSPSLNDRRKVLLENHQINQYFIYLYQLLRNTRERLESNKSLVNEVLILKKMIYQH